MKPNTPIGIVFHQSTIQMINEGKEPLWKLEDRIDLLANKFEELLVKMIFPAKDLRAAAEEVLNAINNRIARKEKMPAEEAVNNHRILHPYYEFDRIRSLTIMFES